jgi:cell division protease FtsH
MSQDVGPIYLGTGEENVFLGREITQEKTFSDATAQRVDAAVREIVENALKEAVALNLKHRDRLDALVKALLETETLDAPEVIAILGPAPGQEDVEAGIVPAQPTTPNSGVPRD